METNKKTRKLSCASPIGYGWYTGSKPITIKVDNLANQNVKKSALYQSNNLINNKCLFNI